MRWIGVQISEAAPQRVRRGSLISDSGSPSLIPMSDAPHTTMPQTLVVVHRPKSSKLDEYKEWLSSSGMAESRFPGFLSREVIEPISEGQDFYTLVVRFDSSQSLGQWLQSSSWHELHSRVETLIDSADRFSTDPHYLTPFWYQFDPQTTKVPTWKIWLSTVVALYPSIFLISLLLQFVTAPFAPTLLLSNLLGVACVSWIAGPIVRRAAKSWMTARPDQTKTTVLGTVAVVLTLLLFLAIFWPIPVGG